MLPHMLYVLLCCWWCGLVPTCALDLKVHIHYPQKNSVVDSCGFAFVVEAAAAAEPSKIIASAPATHSHTDFYIADLTLPDEQLDTQASVAVLASNNITKIYSKECMKLCPKLGPQGLLVQAGAFKKTPTLQHKNVLDLWPDFGCQDWITHEFSFFSTAIKRDMNIVTRVPAAQLENAVARPSQELPPIMFRLNSEWYFDHPRDVYNVWHSLMVGGEMENVVMAEVYVKGVDWQAWDNQPIYTTEKWWPKCSQCDPELEFICKAWEKSGKFGYAGGNHSFGSAAAFFEELWKKSMPHLLEQLPQRTDNNAMRVGAWGYCIGGLAAWNAITTQPDLFNMAYLGSPAMDYDCGDPFHALSSVSAQDRSKLTPKIYIDSGAGEGPLMNDQSELLYRKLQERGLVEGRDVFYWREPFGTHQGRMMLRRSLKGLLTMFGSGSPSRATYQLAAQLSADDSYNVKSTMPWLMLANVAVAAFISGLTCMHVFVKRRGALLKKKRVGTGEHLLA